METDGESVEESADIVTATTETGFLTLPFSEDQFRDFVRSLLGSPQAITRRVRGSFEACPDDFRNLHHLLIQRLSQQNRGTLVQFWARLGFSDDSAVELNAIEELLSYNEVRPIVTMSVNLKWVFLVKFEDKQAPERQTIQVSFYSSGDRSVFIDDEESPDYYRLMPLRPEGVIHFRIEHTARTWGADLEALLSNHLEGLVKTETPLRKFVRKRSGRLGLVVGLWVFTASLFAAVRATEGFASAQLQRAAAVAARPAAVAVSKKLDYLMSLAASGSWYQYGLSVDMLMAVALVLAVAIGIWAGSASDTWDPSYILLSRQDGKHKAKTQQRLQRKWLSFLASVVVGLLVGVASNVLFVWLLGST